jgi:hypothetical protein
MVLTNPTVNYYSTSCASLCKITVSSPETCKLKFISACPLGNALFLYKIRKERNNPRKAGLKKTNSMMEKKIAGNYMSQGRTEKSR